MFWSSSDISVTLVAEPTRKHAATNTTHIAIARHGWVALQRATRTVVEPLGIVVCPSSTAGPMPAVTDRASLSAGRTRWHR
jgi:hypothetical protein